MSKLIARGVLVVGLAGASVLAASPAFAHFDLIEPKQAQNNKGGKGGPPCPTGAATNVVTEVMGGKMLSIKIDETTYHPGHYRVALAPTKEELPAEPAVQKKPGGDSLSATIDPAPKMPVLKDGALVHTKDFGAQQTIDVMIPDMNCDKCVLQVIEFMANHSPPYYYHQCATLKITASGGGTPDAGGAETGAGTGGASGGMGGAAAGTGGSATSTGGSSGSGGSASGGSSGSGGSSSATGGSSGSSGGTSGSRGGSSGSNTGGSSSSPSDGGGSSGGCSMGGHAESGAALALGALVAGLLARRRRRPI